MRVELVACAPPAPPPLTCERRTCGFSLHPSCLNSVFELGSRVVGRVRVANDARLAHGRGVRQFLCHSALRMASPRPRAVAKAAPPDSVASAGEAPTLDLTSPRARSPRGGNRKPAKTEVLERVVVEPVSCNQRSTNANTARKYNCLPPFLPITCPRADESEHGGQRGPRQGGN
jgi:hypothetical protein